MPVSVASVARLESVDERTPLLLRQHADTIRTAKDAAVEERPPLLAGLRYRRQRRQLLKFYKNQAELVECYEKDSEYLRVKRKSEAGETVTKETHEEQTRRERQMDERLAKAAFILNLIVFLAKGVAAWLSHSMSVISLVVESVVDTCTGVAIWLTIRAVQTSDPYQYPRGKERIEPIAVIIISIIIGVANLIVIIATIEAILEKTLNPHVDIYTVVVLLAATGCKAVLLVLCIRQKTTSSRVLALDQRSDIVTNLVGLVAATIGTFLWTYADAIGAIFVSVWVAGSWFYMASDQIPLLSGKVAAPHFTHRIIRIAIEHDTRIRCLDTVIVYHHGNNLLVELHIVMTPDMTLREAHDISEPLQMKLETLPYVERAFVHCDYRLDGNH